MTELPNTAPKRGNRDADMMRLCRLLARDAESTAARIWMLLSALGAIFGMRPGKALLAELRRLGLIMPSRTRARRGRRLEVAGPFLEYANDGKWHAQQLKGRVHPVEQNNTDDAEQQDGKGE